MIRTRKILPVFGLFVLSVLLLSALVAGCAPAAAGDETETADDRHAYAVAPYAIIGADGRVVDCRNLDEPSRPSYSDCCERGYFPVGINASDEIVCLSE